jgi:hypothetical protein
MPSSTAAFVGEDGVLDAVLLLLLFYLRYEGPPGVQGANTGSWQAGGVTRAGAKRSKRP